MHSENFNKNKVRLVSLVSSLFGFLDAFLIYVLSTYFAEASGSENVGVFYLIAYGGVLMTLFFLQPLIRSVGKVRILLFCLALLIMASTLLSHLSVAWTGIVVMLVFIIVSNTTWVALDILLESFSKDQLSGRIRGLYLTIMNAGLLLSPFLSTVALERYGYSGIFFFLVLGYIVVFLITLLGFRRDNAVFQERLRLRETLTKMLREKNLLRIYHVSFGMEFFYAIMIVYMPIYLRSLDFAWHDIGIIFTIMLLPFVFLQYPLGVLADKRFGEKELIIGSLCIVLGATAVLGFLDSTSLFVWGGALFLTRVGIAGIEILRDSYFYKQIDGNDMDVIAFFRTARPVANIVGALVSAVFLVFLPVQGLFFIVALMLSFSLLSAFALEDTESERELAS